MIGKITQVERRKPIKSKVLALQTFSFLLLTTLFSFYFLLNRPVFAQENANVSVTVAPQESDFQFDFESIDGLITVPQETELGYEITYGAYASAGFSTTTVLEADFSNDVAPGGSHVLSYVPGSATNAYGGTVPVVDLTNRKITWTIPNFPQNTTNQTVAFKLTTNSNYTGSLPVDFDVVARMSNEYITKPDETVTQTYVFEPSLVPTPTPTQPVPTSQTTSVSNPSATVAPTLSPRPIQLGVSPEILNIDFTSITSDSASILITTSVPTTQTVLFGTSQSVLNQTVGTDNFSKKKLINLSGLKSDTIYYLRIESSDASGNVAKSEIYTFKTAKESGELVISDGAVSIQSMGQTVYSKIVTRNSSAGFFVLTEDTDYLLNYTLQKTINYKSFSVVIKNREDSGNSDEINLFQKQSLLYSAELRTANAGRYEIYLRAADDNGNIAEWKIADFKVTPKLTIFEKGTNQPVGDARVFLHYYNPKNGKFEKLAEYLDSVKNPSHSDSEGRVHILLPQGKYKAEISTFLYESKTVEFTIGEGNGEDFPAVYLNKTFNIFTIFRNTLDFINDSFLRLSELLDSLKSSVRLFHIVAVGATGGFVLLSIIFFFLKTHLNPKNLPVFFLFGLHMTFNKHEESFVFGTVADKSKNPISRARIEMIDIKTGEVITHTTTNKLGRFHFHKIDSERIKIRISKEGYKEVEISLKAQQELIICLESTKTKSISVGLPGLKILEHIGGSMFETALVLSIIFQILFITSFGLLKTLPFMILSVFNILLWTFFLIEKKR